MPTPLSDNAAGGLQRVFAYARVSTVEQLTENQREQIARAGYDIAPKRFIEEQISGSVPAAQRPGFQRLLERMDEGDTLVVTKLDRIGRDSIDVQQTVERFQSEGIRLVVLQLGNLDLTSSAGALMVKMLAAVADFERDLIIERTQAGQARACAAGTHMGRQHCCTLDFQHAFHQQCRKVLLVPCDGIDIHVPVDAPVHQLVV